MWRDIATIVAENCVNPETKRPYTVTMIEKAMQDLHLSVNATRSSKSQVHIFVFAAVFVYWKFTHEVLTKPLLCDWLSQALEVIKQLQEKNIIPIQRAQMRIRIVMANNKDTKKLREKMMPMIANVEDEDFGEEYELVSILLMNTLNCSLYVTLNWRHKRNCRSAPSTQANFVW